MSDLDIDASRLLPAGSDLEVARFFTELGGLLAGQTSPVVSFEPHTLHTFFHDASQVVEEGLRRQRENDRTQATRFNVFDLIRPDENTLSDILADLLDPEGRHGQGTHFLSLLLRLLGMGLFHNPTAPVRVVREAPTLGIERFRRRIDILVRTNVLVAIENKVDSPEQWEQVKDYLEFLRVHSNNWHVPATLIYLTPNGRRPTHSWAAELAGHQANQRLICWSYERDLRSWLESCVASCQAPKIRHFLGDFLAYIDSDLKRQAVPDESEGDP